MIEVDGLSSDEDIVAMDGVHLANVATTAVGASATNVVEHAMVNVAADEGAAASVAGGAGGGFVGEDDFEVVSFGAVARGAAPAMICISGDEASEDGMDLGVVRVGAVGTGLGGGGLGGDKWHIDEEQAVQPAAVGRRPAAVRKTCQQGEGLVGGP